jgi:hypothetical protein
VAKLVSSGALIDKIMIMKLSGICDPAWVQSMHHSGKLGMQCLGTERCSSNDLHPRRQSLRQNREKHRLGGIRVLRQNQGDPTIAGLGHGIKRALHC